ncbi:MAG: GAF domain-containing protein, partial [Oscillospiraceae bacterium]|nr:GAF domain-containing protein [Oscillospiraceae bacterium]
MHEDDAAYAVRQIVARGIDVPQVMVAADNEMLRQQLGWQPRYGLLDGLQQVWPQLQEVVKARRVGRRQAAARSSRRRIWRRIVLWLENGLAALAMWGVMEMQGGSFVNTFISFDLNYLYIGTFGLVYGRGQALVAMVFASALLIHLWLGMGHDIVGLLYEPASLLHLTSYLFVAFLTGYFADRRDQERHELRWEKNEQKEQYRELLQAYNACMDTKDALYRQIVNSDDSIGRIYNIIRRLDSVDVEQVFDQAASVTAEVLDVHDIAIYIPDANGNYLRSKVRLGTLTQQLPHSLNRQQEDWLQPVLLEQRVFVNRDLLQGRPDLAAPVIYNEQIIAVVAIYGLRFEQWSLSQQNLLSVTTRLIASSLGRARQFESEAEERRYLAGTNILQAEAFQSVLQGLLQRSQRQAQADTGVYLLHLVRGSLTDAELDAKLADCLHAGDFAGVVEDGIAVLLSEVNANTADIVARRLAAAGLGVERQEKVTA